MDNEKKYTVFHPFLLSFFSPDLYRDVGRNWRGICARYLLLLVAVYAGAVAVNMAMDFSGFMENDAPGIIDQVPEIRIRDGVVSTGVPQPHEITDPDSGEVLAVIDTTGQTTSLDQVSAHALLTQSKLLMRKNEYQVQEHDLSMVTQFRMDKDDVYRWAGWLRRWLGPICFGFIFVFMYAFRIVQVLLYAVAGLLFAATASVRIPYPALMRLAAVAITPVVILDIVFLCAGVTLPYWTWVGVAVALVYLYIGVKATGDPGDRRAGYGGPGYPPPAPGQPGTGPAPPGDDPFRRPEV